MCALPILISINALGTANGNIFRAARHCMVGAQCGYLPEFFGFIQEKRLTPLPSIIFQVDFVKFLYRFIIIMMLY